MTTAGINWNTPFLNEAGKYPQICWNISTYGHTNVVIIVAADALAPYGARKSVGTVLIRMLRHVFYEISSPVSVWI